MDDLKEKLSNILSEYFGIGDSYAYNLTRDKAAFGIGTMTMDDFEEFDADTISDIVEYLVANGVTVLPFSIGEWVTSKDGKWCGKVAEIAITDDGFTLYINSGYNFYVRPEEIRHSNPQLPVGGKEDETNTV